MDSGKVCAIILGVILLANSIIAISLCTITYTKMLNGYRHKTNRRKQSKTVLKSRVKGMSYKSVSISQLYKEIRKNPIRAQNDYMNSYVSVSGTVSYISCNSIIISEKSRYGFLEIII